MLAVLVEPRTKLVALGELDTSLGVMVSPKLREAGAKISRTDQLHHQKGKKKFLKFRFQRHNVFHNSKIITMLRPLSGFY
jgi:hypothetical protein